MKNLSTRDLFDVNTMAAKSNRRIALRTGKLLMERTDTSRARIEESNRECADRSEAGVYEGRA